MNSSTIFTQNEVSDMDVVIRKKLTIAQYQEEVVFIGGGPMSDQRVESTRWSAYPRAIPLPAAGKSK